MTEQIDCEKGCFWCKSAKYVPARPAPFPPRPYKKEEVLFCIRQKRRKKNFDLCDEFEDFRGDECK